jgi:hypothetical protein
LVSEAESIERYPSIWSLELDARLPSRTRLADPYVLDLWKKVRQQFLQSFHAATCWTSRPSFFRSGVILPEEPFLCVPQRRVDE